MKIQKSMAPSTETENQTQSPTPVATSVKTTKRGLDLSTFNDVLLYKKVPAIVPVDKMEHALSRVSGDHAKLLKFINDGLQAEAVAAARNDNSGWMLIDDQDKETTDVFSGQLANAEDVNPIVLQFAKLSFGYEDIDSKDPKSAELKKASKDQAKAFIRTIPRIMEDLQKKAAKSAGGTEE